MNAGRAYIDIFQKMRIKNLRGVSGKAEKPPQLSAQPACEG